MAIISPENKKLVKELTAKVKVLQEELVVAQKAAGVDAYIEVKVVDKRASAARIKVEDGPDKGFGQFRLELLITAKTEDVYIPLSIASGAKTAGFMYMIEGTAPGSIKTAEVKCKGEGVTQVAVGTLLFAKIPATHSATLVIAIEIRGKIAETYGVIISRINYKTSLTNARYQQYLKPLLSKTVELR